MSDCDPMDCSTLSFPVLHCPPEFADSCPLSQWCHQPSHPLSSPSPLAFILSQHQGLFQRFFASGQRTGASASASVLPMNIQLISFRIDWFDLLVVKGTLKSHFQRHSSKASVLQCSALFMRFLVCIIEKNNFSLIGHMKMNSDIAYKEVCTVPGN